MAAPLILVTGSAGRVGQAVVRELLARGECVAIFPEGGVPNDPRLSLPLRTGTARIALSALGDGICDDLVVLPAGITYEERGRFRSQVALQIGAPVEVMTMATRGSRRMAGMRLRCELAVSQNFPSFSR